MSFLQTFRIQDPESSGFRILKSSKMFYLQIFRIQDPESSGSKDPAGKSQEGRIFWGIFLHVYFLYNFWEFLKFFPEL